MGDNRGHCIDSGVASRPGSLSRTGIQTSSGVPDKSAFDIGATKRTGRVPATILGAEAELLCDVSGVQLGRRSFTRAIARLAGTVFGCGWMPDLRPWVSRY